MCFTDQPVVTPEMLLDACTYNQVKKLRRWGKRGVRVDGPKLLCLAASLCHTDVMRVLVLRLGANVDQAGLDGWNPLQISAHRDHLPGVRCLVEQLDANVFKVRQETNSTALCIALQQKSVQVVPYLEKEMYMAEEQLC
jgi:ankyrin repeat protein